MTVFLVPYHLDEWLPIADLPVGFERVIEAEFGGGEPWSRVSALQREIAHAVAGAVRPVVVAGDCTAALGVVAGLRRRGVDPSVVWFDAHGDLHTPDSSTSGYLPGMPLRMLIGDGDDTVTRTIGLGRRRRSSRPCRST